MLTQTYAEERLMKSLTALQGHFPFRTMDSPLRKPVEADDLRQEAALSMYEVLKSHPDVTEQELVQVALRAISRAMNKQRKQRVPMSLDGFGREERSGYAFLGRETWLWHAQEETPVPDWLHQAIDQLPDRERAIVQLRYGLADQCEHSQQETACALGISPATVEYRERKALIQLRQRGR